MGLGIGRALAALGGGLSGWGGELADEQRRAAERDSQLSLHGYFRRAPKVQLPASDGVMEQAAQPPVSPAGGATAPWLELSHAMGVDPGIREEGVTRPSTETLEQLKTAVRQSAPKEYTDPVELLGGTYDYRPEDTPEGRRQALQDALKTRQQRAAYGAWRVANPGRSEPFEATDDWQAVMAQRIAHEGNRAATPQTIRVGGREFPDTPEGEALALAWDRRLNPPRATGGGGVDGGGGDMTATQQRAQRLRQAQGRAATLAAEAYARRFPNVVGVVRNHLRQEFSDISEGEIEGIAAEQTRVNRPEQGRRHGASAPYERSTP